MQSLPVCVIVTFMKRHQVKDIIPVALQELHEAGHDKVYVDELGRRITTFDESYIKRRDRLNGALAHVGIHLSVLGSGHLRPGPAKLYPAIYELEQDGVIGGEFEPPREDGAPSRRKYFLIQMGENDT